MSILINLLADTRQAKLRERHRRQLIGGISVFIWVVCGGVVGLMAVYELGQKAVIAGYSNSIKENKAKLEAVPGLMDALTAQQHSESLASLYGKRVYITKFLQAYSEANPSEVKLTSLSVDAQNALIVNGFGVTYAAVAKLARAMEGANVTVGPNSAPSNSPYFSNVSISNVASTSQGVSFTISTNIDSGVTNASGN